MAVLQPYKGGYYLWKYLPSKIAAGLFCALYILATGALFWRIWKRKAWFSIPLLIGGFFQFIGYATRASAHDKTARIMPYAIQNALILIAPVMYAASIYMVLGRVIIATKGEKHSIVRPTLLTKVFVIGDVLALVIQSGAVGLMVTGKHAKLGQGIVTFGLFIQIIMFGAFGVTAYLFHKRMRRDVSSICDYGFNWQRILHMLYAVSALIMFRSIFRVIEYIQGQDGYLLSNEWTLYVFDSVPMLAVMVVFFLWFPSMNRLPNGSDGSLTGQAMFNIRRFG